MKSRTLVESSLKTYTLKKLENLEKYINVLKSYELPKLKSEDRSLQAMR